jgi:hypothetical protein
MKKLFLFILTIVLFVSACKKTECPTPVVTPDPQRIAGNWLGKYSGSDAAAPTTNQFWELKAGGELIVHDGLTTATAPDANKAKGTWVLTGSTFRCSYRFLTIDVNRSVQCTLTGDNKLVGFRGTNGLVTGNGQVEMMKQ